MSALAEQSATLHAEADAAMAALYAAAGAYLRAMHDARAERCYVRALMEARRANEALGKFWNSLMPHEMRALREAAQ